MCRFDCGRPVLTAKGGKSKKTEHPECAQRWRQRNRTADVRAAVFARDGHRCAGCGKTFPESQLEVDHIRGLEFGGDNDPSNYTPRCVRCHEKKTQREKKARASAPAKGAAGLLGDVTAVPAPPRTGMWMGVAGRVWLAAVVVVMAGWAWLDRVPPRSPTEWVGDVQAAVPEALGLAVVPALVPVGVWWVLRWRRNRAVNAQIVFERLSHTVGEAAVDRRRKFHVRKWRGGMPADVTVKVGSDFNPYDEDSQRRLIEEFAAVVGVGPAGVDAVVGRRGRVRLSVRETLPPDDEPDTAAADSVAAGIGEAIAEVIRPAIDEEATVTVTRMDGSRPVTVELRYPPRATIKAPAARGKLLTAVQDAYTQPGSKWFIEHDPTQFVFRLDSRPDPLRQPVPLPEITTTDLHAGIRMGVLETGEPWLIRMAGEAAHLFCAGQTGSGKSGIEWSGVREMGPAIRDRKVRLWMIDPKMGAELGRAKPLCEGRFARTAEEASDLLARFHDTVIAKYEWMETNGLRKIEDFTADHPFDWLVIDEAMYLFNGPDKKLNERNMALLRQLVNISRAAGAAIWAFTQSALKESFAARDEFPLKLALKLANESTTKLVIGADAARDGGFAWRIPKSMPGVGYMVVGGDDGAVPMRLRATWVNDAAIDRLVADFTPALPAPPHGGLVEPAGQPTLPTPEPEPEPEPGWVSWDDLADADLPVSGIRLDRNDPDLVAVTSVRDDPEDADRWLVEFRYDGEQSPRTHSFTKGDCVMRVTT